MIPIAENLYAHSLVGFAPAYDGLFQVSDSRAQNIVTKRLANADLFSRLAKVEKEKAELEKRLGLL